MRRGRIGGEYRIRIYTIGMGELVRYMLGTVPETSESMLMRLANDRTSPDFNEDQLEGTYLLRPDGSGRGTCVRGAAESDHPVEQVNRRGSADVGAENSLVVGS